MSKASFVPCTVTVFFAALGTLAAALPAGAQDTEAMIADALMAAPASLRDTVQVKDWEGNVLREGSGAYTCYPTPPDAPGTSPMCLDATWEAWGAAWMNKADFAAEGTGLAYMMVGDGGASNVDPYATGDTGDNAWVVEGPHLMLLFPDPAMLDGFPTDPTNGGPYVMWKGTPYAHVMVPVNQ